MHVGSCLFLVRFVFGAVIDYKKLGHEGRTTARFGGSGADPTKDPNFVVGMWGGCVLRRQRVC